MHGRVGAITSGDGTRSSGSTSFEWSNHLQELDSSSCKYTLAAQDLKRSDLGLLLEKITRRKRQRTIDPGRQKASDANVSQTAPRRRYNEEMRKQTAITRSHGACIKCKMLRIRCLPDPRNLNGPCLNCQNVAHPLTYPPLCHRWNITQSAVYREQDRPTFLFSRRWQSMDIVDIDTWAAAEEKTMVIAQTFAGSKPYPIRVRHFRPVEGDLLAEKWTSGSEVKTQFTPQYAIVNMEESASELHTFIDQNVASYLIGTMGNAAYKDDHIWGTYYYAFGYILEAKTNLEKSLLRDCFRLWVACRKTSFPHCIRGEETLGATTVHDPDALYDGYVPMPPIIMAQMECIIYTKVLRPFSKKIVQQLDGLVRHNKPEYWLTIYLAAFILLHNCSIITRRDKEVSEQYGVGMPYLNPRSIQKQHMGAGIILAHFHHLNKGAIPFELANDVAAVEKLKKPAALTPQQLEFVQLTSQRLKDPKRAAEMATARKEKQFGHDYYWISQLYDLDWKPGPTA